MSAVANVIILLLSVIAGVSYHRRRNVILSKPLPSIMWDVIAKIVKQKEEKKAIPPPTTPYFGERPHFYTPPSDMEQYRIRKKGTIPKKKLKSILMGEGVDADTTQHHYIPYPNDPPHTFPSIKARAIFTKTPKNLRQVYVESADPIQRTNVRKGAELTVPFPQLEERFRTVYSNAEQSGLEITLNAMKPSEMKKWKRQVGIGVEELKKYNFHSVDALITPPLTDITPKDPIIEEM